MGTKRVQAAHRQRYLYSYICYESNGIEHKFMTLHDDWTNKLIRALLQRPRVLRGSTSQDAVNISLRSHHTSYTPFM